MLKHVTDETTGEGAKRGQRTTGGFFSSLLERYAPALATMTVTLSSPPAFSACSTSTSAS